MPIFEYVCMQCEHKFELLVRTSDTAPQCKRCQSTQVRKLFSVFASASSKTTALGRYESSVLEGGGCGRCGDPNGSCEA
jgi:putative FmdB family regulatory protein